MTKRPLCVDLYCGLGGWTEGFLAEGYDVVGFDIEQHVYGEHRYPAQLVIQDVLTLHGSQFKDAAVIVARSPCQAYSYMAMPWTRAKEQAKWYRDAAHPERLDALNALFLAPQRIQREASEAAGRWIPMVQENVCGAQPWVGKAKWHFGSYYLWGDVPALMPLPHKAVKVTTMGSGWYHPSDPRHVPGRGFNTHADRETRALYGDAGTKNTGGSWFNVAHNTTSGTGQNPVGRKGVGGGWFGANTEHPQRKGSSKGAARKAASARIAKIPFPLANHIARCFHPGSLAESA